MNFKNCAKETDSYFQENRSLGFYHPFKKRKMVACPGIHTLQSPIDED